MALRKNRNSSIKYNDGGYTVVELLYSGKKMQDFSSHLVSNNGIGIKMGDIKITVKINSSGLIEEYRLESHTTMNGKESGDVTVNHYGNFNGSVDFTLPPAA